MHINAVTRTHRRERRNVVTEPSQASLPVVDVKDGGGFQAPRHSRMPDYLRSNLTTANLVGVMSGLLAIVLLLTLPEPWNIRLPLYLTTLVWIILRPRIALYLMPFAIPWGSLDFIDIRGLRMNSADILVAFLAIGWLLSFALRATSEQRQGDDPLDRSPANVPVYLTLALLALLAAMSLSMTVAVNIAASLKEISKWLEFLVLVLLGAQYMRTRRQIWTLVILICLAGITQAGLGYVQAFLNLGPASFVRGASLRIYGTFDQPNPYAGYINILLSIALALVLLGNNWKTRMLAALTVIPLAVAEYLTQSRGAEIAIAAALLFIVIIGMPRMRIFIKLLAVAGLGTIGAFLLGVIPLYVLNPLLKVLGLFDLSLTSPNDQTFSTAERLAHWIAGLHMFLDHPILGVGIGNYADAYPHYFIANFLDPLGHAHNYYINIAAETGSIGLIAYLLFLLAIFAAGGHAYRCISRKWMQVKFSTLPESVAMLTNDRALAIGLLVALISVCVHNLFDNLYVHSLTNLIALLLIALIRLEKVTPNVGGKEKNS